MAAAHNVTIAKASLAASFFRPDPSSTTQEAMTRFHASLDQAVRKCSPQNIQECKDWLVSNNILSRGRTTALGKYLVALTTSWKAQAEKGSRPSSKRKAFHLLLLLNDLLHTVTHHNTTKSATHGAALASNLQPYIADIVSVAASKPPRKYPKHHGQIMSLLNLWKVGGFFGETTTSKLIETAERAHQSSALEPKTEGGGGDLHRQEVGRDTPYTVPRMHGDPSEPWIYLPAGNLIRHLVPDSHDRVDVSLIKSLQLAGGPADAILAETVRKIITASEMLHHSDLGVFDDPKNIRKRGQFLAQDEMMDTLEHPETYFGWSLDSTSRENRFRREDRQSSTTVERISGRRRSSSRDSSRRPHKRQRYESTDQDDSAEGESHHMTAGLGATRRQSRSPRQTGFLRGENTNRPRWSKSPKPSSHFPPVGPRHSDNVLHDGSALETVRDASRSTSRPLDIPQTSLRQTPSFRNQPLVTPTEQLDEPFPAMIPPPPSQAYTPHNFPIGPNGLPIPPPPPFHRGPWPPASVQGQSSSDSSRPFSMNTAGGSFGGPLPQGVYTEASGRNWPQNTSAPRSTFQSPPSSTLGQAFSGYPAGQGWASQSRSNTWHSRPDPRRR